VRTLSADGKSVWWIAWGYPKQETIDPEGEGRTYSREEEARQYNVPCLFAATPMAQTNWMTKIITHRPSLPLPLQILHLNKRKRRTIRIQSLYLIVLL